MKGIDFFFVKILVFVLVDASNGLGMESDKIFKDTLKPIWSNLPKHLGYYWKIPYWVSVVRELTDKNNSLF